MISYGRHLIDQADIDEVIRVLQGDWLTCGPTVERFEAGLAATVNAKHAISCSNGTTALHLAMLALDIKEGDVVLVPAITFLASANAARFVNADVVFVDVDPNTCLITADTLKAAILAHKDKNLKAVVNVHFAGQCEDLEAIYEVAKEHGLYIIEDAAHAVGSSYIDKAGHTHPVGANAFSDLTTFSFHPVKTIAMGEGGAVTTNNDEIARKLKLYRSHGMIRDVAHWEANSSEQELGPWYYEMQEIGYNYRISDINCALGVNQLKKLQVFKTERARMVVRYNTAFQNHPHIQHFKNLKHSDTAWHLYVALIDFKAIGQTRTEVVEHLRHEGINTHVHYMPLYRHPYYKKICGHMQLPGAETYYARCLSLPLYVGLSTEDQDRVIELLMAYA